jgi:putative RNA 2'-phosphotransferase
MDRQLVQLSKTVSHALRHAPWLYQLELDDEGWVPVASLVSALRNDRAEWQNVSEYDLETIIAQSDKRRFEMQGGQIRALYGHSVPQRLFKVSAEPPAILYHGTSEQVVDAILAEGLKPMARQYVHCSIERETAQQVAARKRGRSIILTIHAGAAHASGIRFYRGNELVWLADTVPPQFIEATQ